MLAGSTQIRNLLIKYKSVDVGSPRFFYAFSHLSTRKMAHKNMGEGGKDASTKILSGFFRSATFSRCTPTVNEVNNFSKTP